MNELQSSSLFFVVPDRKFLPLLFSVITNFELNTERRAHDRQDFEKWKMEKEQEEAEKLRQKQREQEEREKEEVERLRQEATFKATSISPSCTKGKHQMINCT